MLGQSNIDRPAWDEIAILEQARREDHLHIIMHQGGILHRCGRQGEELEPKPRYYHRRLLKAIATMRTNIASASSCWPHPLFQTPPLTCPLINGWTLHRWHLDSHLEWIQWMDLWTELCTLASVLTSCAHTSFVFKQLFCFVVDALMMAAV